MDEMEQHAMSLIEDWTDDHTVNLAWSGGIDSLVCLHLCYRLGLQDEIPVVTACTPEFYPSMLALTYAYPEAWDFEYEVWTAHEYDIEWVKENRETDLFPEHDRKQWQMDHGFRDLVNRFCQERESDISIWGNRNEDNRTPKYVDTIQHLNGCYHGAPIRTWRTSHVVAYCDRYNLPISPAYRASPTSGGGPWHRRQSVDNQGNVVEHPHEAWWSVRRFCITEGYTGFWERISSYFSEAEELAAVYAAEFNAPFCDVADGYNRGADERSWPPEVPT
jgi:3'-phosphoadenosine 5'-phosphosulfate sulfotransferase (PAPS reductase)/FAD synthetase